MYRIIIKCLADFISELMIDLLAFSHPSLASPLQPMAQPASPPILNTTIVKISNLLKSQPTNLDPGQCIEWLNIDQKYMS